MTTAETQMDWAKEIETRIVVSPMELDGLATCIDAQKIQKIKHHDLKGTCKN